jgi:hypothetical protein
MRQAERSLHQEVMLRLNAYPVIAIPVPNGLYVPARSPAEKAIVARIIASMKRDGALVPGAPDLVVVSATRAGFLELKRPAENTLLFKSPQGRLSLEQKEFRDRCDRKAVPYAVCTTWDECLAALVRWRVIQPLTAGATRALS